jgi:riboflavin biosynthesis pyrimidine reductase
VRRLQPGPIASVPDDDLAGLYEFPDHRPWVRANFVMTLDGVIRGTDGTSRSIASAADRKAFSRQRLAADVLLVGAGTLRDEDYNPSRIPIAIVTSSLDLPPSLKLFSLRTADTPRTLVYTTEAAAGRVHTPLTDVADVVPCGPDAVDLHRVVSDLAERGLPRIHCEGGPRLLGDLIASDLVDELLITVVPTLHGGPATEHLLTIVGGLTPPLRLRTTQVLEEDGTVLLRAVRR